MSTDVLKELQAWSRESMHRIWQKAKNGELDGLPDEEKKIAQIMLNHQDEYFDQFESADALQNNEHDPETITNPFLHIVFHAAVENQLANRNPVEAYQFYNAMRQKKCSHHDTLHLIARILTLLVYDVLTEEKRFDLEAYKALLKKYKSRKPHKIIDILEKKGDFLSRQFAAFGTFF